MSNRSPLLLSIVLALLTLAGLVGMLIAEGALDAVFFGIAAAPLVIGYVCWKRARHTRRAL